MELQIVSTSELKTRLENSDHWVKITSGEYITVIEVNDPSRQFKGGRSYIISYYDPNSTYICTIHRMTDKRQRVRHEHPKRAIIDGVEFKIQ